MNPFGVLVYLGIDRIIRFIPQVGVSKGLCMSLSIGEECLFNFLDIGNAYLKMANVAQNHYGKSVDLKYDVEHKVFPKYKTLKNFNSNHYCISSFNKENEIVFRYLSLHNGDFVYWGDDPSTTIPINSTAEEIGKAIITVYEMADKTYPKLNILGKLDNSSPEQFVVLNNSTTLFVKNQNSLFLEIIKELTKDNFDESEYSNGLKSYSAASLSSLFNKADLSSFNNLTNNCDELFCFASYSIPGFYGFFHFENGKCIRGYAILDEDGTVQFNIGEKSYVETALKLNLPSTSDKISEDGYDDLNETIINAIAQIWLSK